jgi:hypothetical protein
VLGFSCRVLGFLKMIEVKSYRDLKVWQKSMDLVVICDQLTSKLPKTEIYGLTSQIQRAAVSIPANIPEGKGRMLHSLKEKLSQRKK